MMRLGGGVNHCNNHEGMESNMNAEQWGEYDYEAEDEFDDESSMEDPELMNRTIIVPNFLLNNGYGGYDDDISDIIRLVTQTQNKQEMKSLLLLQTKHKHWRYS